jgi:hypothetical protein
MIRGGPFKAELQPAEAEALMRKVVGQGSFQTLLRSLQKSYDRTTRVVSLTGDQIEKITATPPNMARAVSRTGSTASVASFRCCSDETSLFRSREPLPRL